MRGRQIAAAVAAALLALAGGWYLGSPWWTLWRMREAARAGDVQRFTAWVDTTTINRDARRDYRRWWGSVLETETTDDENSRRFRALAIRRLAVPDREISVPPSEIMPWLAQTPIFFTGRGYRPYLVRNGLDRFEVRDEGADWEMGPLLIFRREGLGWRLVGVRWGQQ